MKKKKDKFTLIVDFIDGKHKEYNFDDFNEYFTKKLELLHDESVVELYSLRESSYTRREDLFVQGAIVDKFRSEFHEYCHGKDCSICRYNTNGHDCLSAFIVDHYENNGGNNND